MRTDKLYKKRNFCIKIQVGANIDYKFNVTSFSIAGNSMLLYIANNCERLITSAIGFIKESTEINYCPQKEYNQKALIDMDSINWFNINLENLLGGKE